jgi:hypothetical protein
MERASTNSEHHVGTKPLGSLRGYASATVFPGHRGPGAVQVPLPEIEHGRLLGQVTCVFPESYNKVIVVVENATAV